MSKPPLLVVGRPAPYIAERIGAAFTPVTPDTASDEQRRTLRGVAVCAAAPFDAAMLAGFPALEIAANFGVGYDNVDARAAASRGVIVTNTPDVLTEEVADLAIGLLIATVRQLPQADSYLRRGSWLERPFPFTATLRTRSFGILGLGRIGRAVAARLDAFGRPIAYHGRRRQPDVPYRYYPSLLAMAEDVDTLIVVAPGGPDTKGIVNAEVLAALGADGIVINVGRGTVVDEAALVAALAGKVILSAGLDVFEDEPRVPSALIGMDHVVLLPHVGSASTHTRAAMAQLMVDNLVSWFAGRGPLTPVPETPWPRR
jgi:lactate dehydrogenase-like 2-hydroxyacid dehydrogenase